MDPVLQEGINKEENSADKIVNDQITEKGNELDNKMNQEMDEYRAQLIEEMEASLADKKKELEEQYPDDPEQVEKELKKLREPMMKVIDEKCQVKYQEELKVVKSQMDEHLDQRVTEIHSALKGMLSNPMGAFEDIIKSLVAVGIGDIEERLKRIQNEIGIPLANIVTSRAERNGLFDMVFKQKTASDPTVVDPEATKKPELPGNTPTVGGGFGGGIQNDDKWKIEDEIRNEAMSKVDEIKRRSIDGLRQKISQKIHCVTGIRIENMIGSDIRWPK